LLYVPVRKDLNQKNTRDREKQELAPWSQLKP